VSEETESVIAMRNSGLRSSPCAVMTVAACNAKPGWAGEMKSPF
jgi:hypothetical protein